MCSCHHQSDLRKKKARYLTLAEKHCLALLLIPIEFSSSCAEKLCEGNIKSELLKKNHNTHRNLTKLIAAQHENLGLEYLGDRLERYQICEHNYSRVKMSEPIALK